MTKDQFVKKTEEILKKLDRDAFRAGFEGSIMGGDIDVASQALYQLHLGGVREIGNQIPEYFLEWRAEINKAYEDGRKDRKSTVLLDFPTWLGEKLKK